MTALPLLPMSLVLVHRPTATLPCQREARWQRSWSFPMNKVFVLAIFLCLSFATIVLAQPTHVKPVPANEGRKIPSLDFGKGGFVLRQDLFDRNDPNNLRSDYPGPPAQPGPAH
jgi:hypothetical protein